MKKLTTEEALSVFTPLPDSPVEGTTGPETYELPRQCPVCDTKHSVRSERAVRSPIERFELCPDCWRKESEANSRVLERRHERLSDLPEVERPTAEDYYY